MLVLIIVSYSVLTLINAQSFVAELKLIQVIFRHGHSAPSSKVRTSYPLDPYVNETWYPQGWGGLNNRGKQSAYDLGAFLRERYGQWLGDIYEEDAVQFRSSHRTRVIMSTQLVAAGLFPPSTIQTWNSDLNWQPIPVYFEPFKADIFSLCKFHCPKHKSMRLELEERDAHLRQRAEDLRDFFHRVSENVGTNIGQEKITGICHQLNAELSEGVKLPEWTKGIFPDGKMEKIAGYDYVIQSYNKTMIHMNGGPWIREWLENVDNRLNESRNGHRGYFYGGHDGNIAAILIALGVFKPHVPFFSSAVIFELSSNANDEFYVKVLYRDRDILQELLIPGCAVNCPLVTFRKLFHEIVLEDPVALCQED